MNSCRVKCTTCMSNACGGQKRLSDTLKVELQMVVSCHVYVGNKTESPVPHLGFWIRRGVYLDFPSLIKGKN